DLVDIDDIGVFELCRANRSDRAVSRAITGKRQPINVAIRWRQAIGGDALGIRTVERVVGGARDAAYQQGSNCNGEHVLVHWSTLSMRDMPATSTAAIPPSCT